MEDICENSLYITTYYNTVQFLPEKQYHAMQRLLFMRHIIIQCVCVYVYVYIYIYILLNVITYNVVGQNICENLSIL